MKCVDVNSAWCVANVEYTNCYFDLGWEGALNLDITNRGMILLFQLKTELLL